MKTMTKMTIEEIKEYAKTLGYDEELDILDCDDYYEVSFGHEYTQMWVWYFDDLDGQSSDFDHLVWED